jgi:predicted transcriptional regulator
MSDADSVTAFSHAFNDQSLSVVADRAGDLAFQAVLTRGAVDALTGDERLSESLRSVITGETASVNVYDGEIPVAVTIADDVVNILARDDRGVVQASVDSSHEDVREWAQRRFEHYRVQSEPLTVDDLTD